MGLSNSAATYIRSNLDIVSELPDGEFTSRDLPGYVERRLARLSENNVIENVGQEHVGDGHYRGIWVVPESVAERIEELQAHRNASGKGVPMLPCGHTGFSNVPDSPYYECKTCEKQFTRSEMPV